MSERKIHLGCCFKDSEENRKLAIDLAVNFNKTHENKQLIVVYNKQIRSINVNELDSLKNLFPNLEVINDIC